MNLYQILIIEQYLLSIKVKLLYAPKRKHEIIKDFRKFIYSCIKENPEDTVKCKQDLYDLFGTVDRVVRNNMSLQDEIARKNYEKLSKKYKIIISLFIIGSFILMSLVIWINVTNNQITFVSETGIIVDGKFKVTSSSSVDL